MVCSLARPRCPLLCTPQCLLPISLRPVFCVCCSSDTHTLSLLSLSLTHSDFPHTPSCRVLHEPVGQQVLLRGSQGKLSLNVSWSHAGTSLAVM